MENNAHRSQQEALSRLREASKLLSAREYFEGIRSGNRNILGRAITLIESTQPDHQQLAVEVLTLCLPYAGNSVRIGITGVPGVGKSSFIEAFGHFLTSNGKKIAVLAVDPSSKVSGGSILGDKTRMEKLSSDPLAFIRPSPSSNELGGVAGKTREAIILCEAAGFECIIVETVGVGQSEVEVKSMVDFFMLLMLAGAGDELQGIKRGIMEMADALLITKADGKNEEPARLARQQYKSALHLFPPNEKGWLIPVETCSSVTGKGISEAWEMIERYQVEMKLKGFFERNRREQALSWMHDVLKNKIMGWLLSFPEHQRKLEKMEQDVLQGKASPYRAVEEFIHSLSPVSQPNQNQ